MIARAPKPTPDDREDRRRADAAEWVVRLQAGDLSDADVAAFDAWLSASDANGPAYDDALAVMQEVEAKALAIAQGLRRSPANARRAWIVAGGMAAAASIAIAVAPYGLLAQAPQTYVTGKGEHRTVKLADGSVVDLNAGAAMTVSLGRHERHIDMPRGEAVFDVAPDSRRPFMIAVGDRTVRVVGTRFDVRRHEGRLSVTVERGVVEVLPADGAKGRAYRLHPGQRLDHAEGQSEARIRAAAPGEVFAWRTGRLIYRDEALRDVVVDLNQQFATPIQLRDPAQGETRFSGVLVLDDQAAVIRRLSLLAPITALPSERAIAPRRDEAARP